MRGFRACVLLVGLVAIAFAAVWLRAEQTRVAASSLRLEAEWIGRRRELWAVQTSVARLRTPGRVRHGVTWFETELLPPEAEPSRHTAILVSDGGQER